jgi:hypothetical protein
VAVNNKSLEVTQRNNLIQQEISKLLFAMSNQEINLEVENPEQYVNRYEYVDIDNDVFLKIYFDKKLINTILTENKHRFLDDNRPLTIIWPKRSTKDIIIVEQLLQQIASIAHKRKVPLVLPMLDVKEITMLHKDIVKNNFNDLLKAASKKYFADEIITVDCNVEENILKIHWRSVINNWQFKHDITIDDNINLTKEANLLLDQLMKNFLEKYVGDNLVVNKEVIVMKINNIINLEDYVKIEKYLQNLSVVNSFSATKFQPGEIEFEIIAVGGKQSIINALATNELLQEQPNTKNLNGNIIHYTLNIPKSSNIS